MSEVVVFMGSVVKHSKGKYIVYPLREYNDRLEKLHRKRVVVLVVPLD